MITGYSTVSNAGVPYAVLGEGVPGVLIIPGIEPEHHVPEGLRLQGVRGAFEDLAAKRPIAVAWRADRAREQEPVTIASIAEDYAALARELELADLAVVGISTGGAMAIETAARLGERCSRLALVSAGACLSPEGRALLLRAVGYAEQGDWRRLGREQMAAFYPGFFGSTVLGTIAWLFPSLYGEPEDPSHFISLTRAVAEADLRARSEDVFAKALVINGERDLLYPPEVARQTALLLADGEAVIIPRAGHGAFKSHPGRINKLLVNYLWPDSGDSPG